MKLPYAKSPCSQCPFRKDTLKGWLGRERMTEITEAHSFVCHKKTDMQCAGHMLLNQQNNTFVEMAARFRIELELRGRELLFNNVSDCIEHHADRN
ncbi:DUF6283 family protein [Methylophaga sp.]|uniref:DUF6283 family protein n=1 Tax=Methylophaga sp. TaxID=2024840 RepID=UPI00272726D1|nr:DUF6283 family protein [Methylophaga sp.]MDO8826026.1 DUF6283 family protein [Methylophaga sp.]